jgi:phosphatidylinositol alpha-1,6-mannosyltransferase
LNLLLVTDKFIPERGGSQIILANLYAHLPGCRVTVVTRSWEGDEAADRDYPHRVIRVPYSRVPRLRSPLLWLALTAAARRLSAKERFDQLHLGQTVETAPLGVPLARRLGIPAVVHTFAEDVTTWKTHCLYGPLMRRALRQATLVTSISRYTVEHLREMGIEEERIRLLYPGVEPDDWRATGNERAIRERFGLEGMRVILTLARLIPRKGQDTVLRALPEVLRRAPDAVYLIVGGGPHEPALRRLAAELGVEERVRWAGSIPNREAVDYYHAADVFAMPNRRMPDGDIEGFGLVFLEANACGLPVIGGRSGGAVDAIADGISGYLVDPGSPAELAERLVYLLAHPDRAREMGLAGRARVERSFTWRASGEALAGVARDAARIHARDRPPAEEGAP